MYHNLSTKDFIYFKTVTDEKSISKAAKKLFIAQPSLSQHIRRIEDQIGMPLYSRSSSGITLTYAGERFYALAANYLRSIDDFTMEIGDISNMTAGKIQFGITRYLGSILLPLILPSFRRQCPNIAISMTEVTSSLQEEALLANQIDFTLMHLPIAKKQNPSIQYLELGTDPFMLVLPRNSYLSSHISSTDRSGYPVLDIECLKNEHFIMVNKGQRIRQIADSILEKADILHPNVILESTSFSTVADCISAGLGISLLPKQYLLHLVSTKNLLICSLPEKYDAVWSICVASSRTAYLSKADNLFLSIAMDAIEASLSNT